MPYSKNHGWGRLIAESLRSRPRVGKILIVAAATNINWEELNEIFPPSDKIRVLTTLPLALTEATASQDDVIYIAPYHTENITGAAGIAMSKAGVSVIGLGQGTSRPTFTWTTAVGASWDVSAADCLIENCLFDLTGFDAVTAGFNITAANCHFQRNEVITADATNQAVLGLLTNASGSGLLVEDCIFRGTVDAGTTAAIRIVGGSNITIRRNHMVGAYSLAIGAIDNLTTLTANLLIEGNSIRNLTTLSANAIRLNVDGASATIVNNRLGVLTGTTPVLATALVAGPGLLLGGNYYRGASSVAAGTLL